MVDLPALYHARQCIAAFAAGAHVSCAKPLCMDWGEAEAIVAAAKRAGRLFTHGVWPDRSRVDRALKSSSPRGGLG